MSIFSNWFGSKPDRPRRGGTRNLEEHLATLEKRSEESQPGHQGLPLNRAGDACLEAGDRDRALTYYGRAIDVLLGEGQSESARGVANKIIRVHPQAIRTRCTLTWLDLSAQHMATALDHLRDYVEAAKRGGVEELARDHILDMARVVPDEEFVDAAADALDLLDYAADAAAVRHRSLPGINPVTDPEELARICVEAAVGSNFRPNIDRASG